MPKPKPKPEVRSNEWKPAAKGFALYGMLGSSYRILGRIIPDYESTIWKVTLPEGARLIADQQELGGRAINQTDAVEIVEILSEKLAKMHTDKVREGMGRLT